jgi:D-alanine-D-alanine ligase
MKVFDRNTPKNNRNNRNQMTRPIWTVALIANVKDEFTPDPDDPPDAGAEFDRWETIHNLTKAIQSDGHSVVFLQADKKLPKAIINLKPDIVFNIAEGISGDSREAQVPALCELLGIPYTASRILPNAISLDKTMTKRIWRDHGLPTAPFQEFSKIEDVQTLSLNFPLFVKPAREGTGMGIDDNSLVHNMEELEERVEWVLKTYRQPALVEEFLPDSVSPTVYGHDAKSIDIGDTGAPDYLCPADIPDSLAQELISLTRKAAEALNVCDISRIDYRMGADGKPYLLEINTLPGLNPAISDICIMADAENLPYNTLITEILYLAAERFRLPFNVFKWDIARRPVKPVSVKTVRNNPTTFNQ